MPVDLKWRPFTEKPTEVDGLRKLCYSIEQFQNDGSWCFYNMQILLVSREIVPAEYFYNRRQWIPKNKDISGEIMVAWRPDPKTHMMEVPSGDGITVEIEKWIEEKYNDTKPVSEMRPLFHFTRSIDNLCGIIREGFNHRNSKETLPMKGAGREGLHDLFMSLDVINTTIVIPMVCFCDMERSEMTAHREQYGRYAIGLSKDWGIKNNVTPARYVHEKSPDLIDPPFYDAPEIQNLLQNTGKQWSQLLLEDKGIDPTSLPQEVQSVLHVTDRIVNETTRHLSNNVFLMKVYNGVWSDRETELPTQRLFYDEREWRSVRTQDQADNLIFEWDDITNILVDQEKDVDVVIKQLGQDASRYGSQNDIDHTAKISLIKNYIQNA